MTYDLIIIGGGPAAVGGGVYAGRKHLQTLVIAPSFGGQSIVSPEIYNWIGTPAISGDDLAKSLRSHLKEYEGDYVTVEEGSKVTKVEKHEELYTVTTNNDVSYNTKAILVASGAAPRKLDIPGAKEFEMKGVVYCASCDGPLFTGMDVVVIGGGNAGFEAAAQLLAYAKSVTLLDINSFRADPVTIEKVLTNENMTAIKNAETVEILGDKMVTGLRYKDVKTGEESTIDVQGVFVEIGVVPNTDMVTGVVELNESNHIVVDPKTQKTSADGIWAAGDCTDGLYAQNNIAVGDAIKALEDIYIHLKT